MVLRDVEDHLLYFSIGDARLEPIAASIQEQYQHQKRGAFIAVDEAMILREGVSKRCRF